MKPRGIIADEAARSLGLRRNGRGYIGRCPSCGYGGAFTVEDRKGTMLVRCHAGCDQRDVINALRRAGLWTGGGDPVGIRGRAEAPQAAPVDAASTTKLARSLWDRAISAGSATAGPLGRYLAHRGYAGPIPCSLRLLVEAHHKPSGTQWPAMLAAVTREPTGAIVAVHRTFLRPDGTGKAPVDPSRMTLGRLAGGAVRLAPAARFLAVTEGIETGLAVLKATGVATWAALSAGGIRSLVLPPLPLAAAVTICADHDAVGIAAAHAAAECWHREGRRVRIAVPPQPESDFNDLALATEAGP